MEYIDPRLLEKYAAGQCTEEERKVVELWLEGQQALPPVGASNLDEAEKQATETRLLEGVRNGMNVLTPVGVRKLGVRWTGWAAAALVFFGLAGWLSYKWFGTVQLVAHVPAGVIDTVYLSDGSLVYLNAGARLKYPPEFPDDKRELTLEAGEAFFAVAPDAARPFSVHVAEARVEVLGTEFNVNKLAETVAVTLTTGKVVFHGGAETVTLLPGQQAVYALDRHTVDAPKPVDTLRYVAWKDGTLWFEDTPMNEVLATLGRQYGVRFELNRATVNGLLFTGKFRHERMEDILQTIMQSSDLRFRPKGEGIMEVY